MNTSRGFQVLALGFLLLLGGCVKKAPDTRPHKPKAPDVEVPSDPCQAFQKRLATSASDPAPDEEAAREELREILAALRNDPALRACFAPGMASDRVRE